MPDGCSRTLTVIFLWFCLSFVVGASGLLTLVPAAALQGILFAFAAGTLLLYFTNTQFSCCVNSLALPVIVLFHVTRFVGFYFLYLYERGRLPYEFAVYGGWGDILVAATAGLAALCGSPRVLWAWNLFGLADILFVVTTAARMNFVRPGSMWELTSLPLSLLPTFLVPLIIASHVIIFDRLRRQQRAAAAVAQLPVESLTFPPSPTR